VSCWKKRCAFAALLLLLPSCERVKGLLGEKEVAPVSRSYPVQIVAFGDANKPLAGVELLLGKRTVGTTDAAGSLKLSLKGNEGDVVNLSVKCPESFASPEGSLSVGLRHFAEGSPPPRFETRCIPLVHSFVVGIRTENGANLPILRLDKTIGKTDDFGVAHLLVQAAPHDQVALTLDTTDFPMLRPQKPTLSFAAPDHDELVLLEQKFTVLRKVVHVKAKVIPQKL
jgi:hypothetical protein